MNEIKELKLDQITPNENQPRKHFDEVALQELAESIREVGLLNPVLVRPNGSGYELVHGERRWRACELIGQETIRANIRDLDDEQAFLIAFTENLQRDDLNPIEEARALKRLTDDFGYSQTAAGKKIGKSQQYIADRLVLLRLSEPVQELITARAVTPSIGRELASIPDERWQLARAKKAAKGELTTRELQKSKKFWLMRNDTAERDKALGEFFEVYPHLERFREGVEKEQIDFVIRGPIGGQCGYLQINSTKRNVIDQDWNWPKYSGQSMIIGPGNWRHDLASLDEFGENRNLPLFSETEWDEFCNFHEAAVLGTMKPVKGWGKEIRWPKKRERETLNLAHRRLYDHDYGGFLIEPNSKFYDPAYIKKGWGIWQVIAFNDGQGKRTQRRFFGHDYILDGVVKQLAETVDPYAYSHNNFKRMKIWQSMPHEINWAYVRRKTIDREAAIAALEADLEVLRNTTPLTSEVFGQRLLDELQNYRVGAMDAVYWREGIQTYPRLPDGSVDKKIHIGVLD